VTVPNRALRLWGAQCATLIVLSFRVVVALEAQDTSHHGRAVHERVPPTTECRPILWREPTDIQSRNLYFGPGGSRHQPQAPFTFDRENLNGTNPKFVVRDVNGVKWTIKLGEEARPETVASRLVWAAGYFSDTEYLLPAVQVDGMPTHVHRGEAVVGPGGSMTNARFKHETGKKVGTWGWRDNPFTNTRPLNGLRVLMAIINNWDLKDANNAVRQNPNSPQDLMYEVSDLGASFGSAGRERTRAASKDNLDAYRHSRFIDSITPMSVDFDVPRRPALILLVDPRDFFSRLRLQWIGRDIPREDARWMGGLLARITPDQLRDAFSAGGYRGDELNGLITVLRERIAQLDAL
jgi:hypothetical protein